MPNNDSTSIYIKHHKTAWTKHYLFKINDNTKKLVPNINKIAENSVIIESIKYSTTKIIIKNKIFWSRSYKFKKLHLDNLPIQYMVM